MSRNVSVVSILALLTGCAGRPETAPRVPSDDARHRAALAVVTVRNETVLDLEIAFRAANPPQLEVVVGRVPPRSAATVAPVPAGEPIVLIARNADRATLELPARSLPIGAWEWVVPRDAVFRTRAP